MFTFTKPANSFWIAAVQEKMLHGFCAAFAKNAPIGTKAHGEKSSLTFIRCIKSLVQNGPKKEFTLLWHNRGPKIPWVFVGGVDINIMEMFFHEFDSKNPFQSYILDQPINSRCAIWERPRAEEGISSNGFTMKKGSLGSATPTIRQGIPSFNNSHKGGGWQGKKSRSISRKHAIQVRVMVPKEYCLSVVKNPSNVFKNLLLEFDNVKPLRSCTIKFASIWDGAREFSFILFNNKRLPKAIFFR